jgi:hypothetical protein
MVRKIGIKTEEGKKLTGDLKEMRRERVLTEGLQESRRRRSIFNSFQWERQRERRGIGEEGQKHGGVKTIDEKWIDAGWNPPLECKGWLSF